jgi:hypothetical protein
MNIQSVSQSVSQSARTLLYSGRKRLNVSAKIVSYYDAFLQETIGQASYV